MKESEIQLYLLACLLVANLLLLLWNYSRRFVTFEKIIPTSKQFSDYRRLKRISKSFWILFMLFTLMILIYSLFPDVYFIFIPIQYFDNPFLNTLGLLVTKLALAWILVAQIQIDKEVFKYVRDINSLAQMELVYFSEYVLVSGMVAFFIGIFITITNIVGLIFIIYSLIMYFKMNIIRKYFMK